MVKVCAQIYCAPSAADSGLYPSGRPVPGRHLCIRKRSALPRPTVEVYALHPRRSRQDDSRQNRNGATAVGCSGLLPDCV
jgi:hypothetical protein